ncbi:hypothetical protein Trydic_g15797 [Trypoxylus dichotomus]
MAPYQLRDPEAVITSDRCKMYWNFSFSTTTQLPDNKPDLVIPDSLEKKMNVIEMSCPADTNIADKEDEKIRKYKDLMYDFKNTYKEYETILIPIIVGVMGGMKSNMATYLGKIKIIKSKHIKGLINQMQKYVILGSLPILRSHEASHSPTKG